MSRFVGSVSGFRFKVDILYENVNKKKNTEKIKRNYLYSL